MTCCEPVFSSHPIFHPHPGAAGIDVAPAPAISIEELTEAGPNPEHPAITGMALVPSLLPSWPHVSAALHLPSPAAAMRQLLWPAAYTATLQLPVAAVLAAEGASVPPAGSLPTRLLLPAPSMPAPAASAMAGPSAPTAWRSAAHPGPVPQLLSLPPPSLIDADAASLQQLLSQQAPASTPPYRLTSLSLSFGRLDVQAKALSP